MRYLSVCSGIEAATVAWHGLGWTPVGFGEIEPFPSAVLAHHYPNVPNFGDMTKHEQWTLQPGSIDLLVAGTPCQSFSVAGLRQGLKDPRGNLMLTYLAIAARLRPQWVVWENVPGVLSSNGGRDFGSFLGALGELGYGWAYRVLDAQWCRTHGHPRAVPQRRRRVFVVGCLGDWTRAAQVLFERESVQRNSAKSGTAREEIAGTLAARSGECRNNPEQLVAGTPGRAIAKSRTELDNHGAYIPVFQPVPYDLFQITAPVNRQNRQPGDPCHTLARDNAAHAAVAQAMTVRRLTARECERLQAFPDDYTLIPWRKKQAEDCPDGPRYKALGNSMAVNCMAWIGERIAALENNR
jgi:DNA (cytosine-5)-methyltransferase 1